MFRSDYISQLDIQLLFKMKTLRSFSAVINMCLTSYVCCVMQHLGELVLGFLNRDLQPSCLLACLETVRILSRDKHRLDPFITRSAMLTLARYAGIVVDITATPAHSHLVEGQDQEVIVEALKSICNILLHNETGQVRFFDLRLTFLLTALRVDVRTQLAQELHGISLLGNLFPVQTLAGFESIPPEELPPLSREQAERAMEILKILFNITFDTTRRKVDEEEAAEYRHLGAILRHCLLSHADGEERTEEFHSHTVNLLGNLPLPCLDVLLMPKVQQGSIEYMGVNMDAVNMLLEFMERKLDRGHKLKETLLPSLNLLTESARIHRETRKFLRSKVLPPLRDVKNRPEVGNALRNKIVRLMTHIDTDVKDYAAEFLFVLCKENVSRFIKYTGYGNAAGLLAARGLLRGGRESGIYSEDEDSETEEYREAKAHINPITGVVEEEQPNPMEGMTEEQKELEAMKLVSMFDRLSRCNVIQPMQLGMDGKMREMTPEDLHKVAHNPLVQSEEPANSESEDDAQ
uniref:Synembryn n=1 Tax=Amphiprion ocellaris TaxID=80972 RepID=A0AAQ5YP80_AMPOC